MILNSNSVIEINKKALSKNIEFIKKKTGPHITISSVLKGNAYGHGIKQMVPLLEEFGINHFSVFGSSEAKKVFKYSKKGSTIMVMGDICKAHLNWLIENNIECFVFNIERLEELYKTAKALHKMVSIHIELETGMNRTGISKENWKQLANKLQEYKHHIYLKGICTHFAGAESISNYLRVQKQKKAFKKGVLFFKEQGFDPEKIHTSCSAALLSFPKDLGNMVRIGILQYGLWPSKETQVAYLTKEKVKADPIERIVSWKSYIMDIKSVKTGEFIGYGMSYQAGKDMKIASIPIGYGHGFNRSLSNQGRVLINGNRYGVIGTVNMNMFLVDITNSEANIGDRVTLIGDDGDKTITVSYFGNLSNQLNYELLSRIDKDIPRVVV